MVGTAHPTLTTVLLAIVAICIFALFAYVAIKVLLDYIDDSELNDSSFINTIKYKYAYRFKVIYAT